MQTQSLRSIACAALLLVLCCGAIAQMGTPTPLSPDERKKAEAEEREKAIADRQPSLFVIILRYIVALEKIDSAMKQHITYLNKHYATGDFLVSGRQVPRTGGIIIARAGGREAVEKIVKQDPFVKNNKGDLDFITVFDLPYAMETVAYHTAIGKFSPVFRTAGGYIILKKTEILFCWLTDISTVYKLEGILVNFLFFY